MQPRMTGLLTLWLLGLISILLEIPTAIKWDYNSADNCHFVIAAKKPNTSGELGNGSSLHAGFYDLILFFPVSSFILILDRCV